MEKENVTGNKLMHITHVEDLILFGEKASDLLIKTLSDVVNTLQKTNSTSNITTKIDGAPSFVAASNFHGDKFVATKGFFAKNRKLARTQSDIKELYGHEPQLARKMGSLLNALDLINIPENEIWQGDFLFDRNVFYDNFGGERCLVFHPNTIVYAIPVNSSLGAKAAWTGLGIAWHTRYTGSDFGHLSISFDVSCKELTEIPTVFQIDSSIQLPNNKLFLNGEFIPISNTLLDIEARISYIKDKGFLHKIEENSLLQSYFLSFQNYLIKEREAQFIDNYFNEIKTWIENKLNKEIEKKKTDAAKNKWETIKDQTVNVLDELGEDLVTYVADTQKQIVTFKETLIHKLKDLSYWKTFLKHKTEGYVPTDEEGYTISDSEGNILKFVNRLEFSKANFSEDIVKGWTKVSNG